MTRPTDDKLLDEYLSGKSRVSEQYRAMDADDVPSHLDDRILAQARAAIAAPVDEVSLLREKRRRLMRWSIPTAIAASALLVVSIVIRSGTQHELQPTAVPAEAPAMAKPQVAAVEEAAAENGAAENGVVLIAPPRNAVSESSPFAPMAAQRALQQQELAARQARSIAASAEAARRAMEDHALALEAPTELQAPPPAPPPAEELAPDPQQTAVSERRLSATADQAKRSVARAEQESAMVGARSAMPAAAAPVSADDAAIDRTQPDVWLEYIRQLRREDKHEDADDEWRAFREKFPDHVVSETDIARSKP